jgi:hypothetical protein
VRIKSGFTPTINIPIKIRINGISSRDSTINDAIPADEEALEDTFFEKVCGISVMPVLPKCSIST